MFFVVILVKYLKLFRKFRRFLLLGLNLLFSVIRIVFFFFCDIYSKNDFSKKLFGMFFFLNSIDVIIVCDKKIGK